MYLQHMQVRFNTPVSIVDRRINEWLSAVEEQIRVTLAMQLALAVEDVKAFNAESIDSAKYLEWVDKYQVRTKGLSMNVRRYIHRYMLYFF